MPGEILTYLIAEALIALVGGVVDNTKANMSGSLRGLAAKINAILSKNSNEYAKFKSKNADEQARIVQSIITSSGLGPRFASLKRELQRKKTEDEEVTARYNKAQVDGQKKLDEVNTRADNARSNVFQAAGESIGSVVGKNDIDHPDEVANRYDVTNVVNGGLNGQKGQE